MNIRSFFELAQKGNINANKDFPELSGLLSTSPCDLANSIIDFWKSKFSNSQSQFFIDKTDIMKESYEFHKRAGTLTEEVRKNIDLLKNNVPIIRIAHTPDQFAYLGVYISFVLLDIVVSIIKEKTNLQSCQVYLNIDSDIVEDKRLRTSYFPDVDKKNGSLSIATPISHSNYNKVIRSIDKPSKKTISEWILSLKNNINYNLRLLYRSNLLLKEKGQIFRWFEAIEQEIWESYNRALSLGDFNTIFLSRVINLNWKLPTAFLSAKKASKEMKECYEYLLAIYPKFVELSKEVIDDLQSKGISINNNLRLNLEKFPFWYICPNCFERIPLSIISSSRFKVNGSCNSCGAIYKCDIGTFSNPKLDPIIENLVPKVFFDEITDIIGWKFSGGVNYIGGIEHTLTNTLIAYKFGLSIPPECFWRPRGIHWGVVEGRSSFLNQMSSEQLERINKAMIRTYLGRASIIYYLLSQGFSGLYRMWERHFDTGKHSYEINIGEKNFLFSANQISNVENKIKELEKSI